MIIIKQAKSDGYRSSVKQGEIIHIASQVLIPSAQVSQSCKQPPPDESVLQWFIYREGFDGASNDNPDLQE